jgi:hypothetical protein
MSNQLIGELAVRERECIHRSKAIAGRYYSGELYIQSLQRLRGSAALKVASKVGAFFWSDAPLINVWLCSDCACEAGLGSSNSDLSTSLST